MARLFEQRDDITVIDAAASDDELDATVSAARPHVVLTDIRMPPTHIDEG